jgi:hypothetical protein
MPDVLQRFNWNGQPRKIDICWRLHKAKRKAECEMWSHILGWELRLIASGELLQSQVCRTQDEVFDTFEQWKAAMVGRGWTPQ